MRATKSPVLVPAAVAALLLLAGADAPRANAACNLQPTTLVAHPGDRGSIDSPFLLPSVPRTLIGTSALGPNDRVSIAYLPPPGATGAPTLMVLRPSCSGWTGNECNGSPQVSVCAEVQTTVNGAEITFPMPAYAGEEGKGTPTTIRPQPEDKVYRTGPVRLAVSAGNDPVPCGLATLAQPCQTPSLSGLKVCIDTLRPSPVTPIHERIERVTALPAYNDYAALCESTPDQGKPCKGGGEKLQFAIDGDGHLLIPMQWTDALSSATNADLPCLPTDSLCGKRIVKASTSIPAKASQPKPITIPESDDKALQSFNPGGETFVNSPDFGVDTSTGADPEAFNLLGTADKHLSVLRVLACPNGERKCADEPRYFKLGHRMKEGKGPVTVLKKGQCEGGPKPGQECNKNEKCGPGGACVRMGAHADANILAIPVPVPAPPPPPPAPLPYTDPQEGAGGEAGSRSITWLLLAAVLLVSAWMWWRR